MALDHRCARTFVKSATAGVALLSILLTTPTNGAAATSTDPIVVTKKGLIHISGEFKMATRVDHGRAAVKIFPLPAKPSNYECKRVDIYVVPYGKGGFGKEGGRALTKSGCSSTAPRTKSARFTMVQYAKERAAKLCRSKNPGAGTTVKTQMTVGFQVKKRYCFLDMKGDERPGGTHWSVNCATDGVWVNKTVYFPVTVSCDKSD
jgi:hypothetical protein